MSGFLLDTNCISELVRIKPDSNVAAWIEDAEESLLYLSVLTLGEVRKGLASLRKVNEEVSSKRGSKSSCTRAFREGSYQLILLSPIDGDCSPQTPRQKASQYLLSMLCLQQRSEEHTSELQS